MENVIAKILCGGCRYDTTDNHKDIDYLVILDEDIKHKRTFDKENNIDYICYGKNFIDKLLNKEETFINLQFLLIDLMGQNEYPVNYDVLNDIDYVKSVFVNWLTENGNAVIKCIPRSKRIFYAFVLMYWAKNNAYILTNEQQEIVNKVHQMKPIEDNICDEFTEFFGLNKWFNLELKCLQNVYATKINKS